MPSSVLPPGFTSNALRSLQKLRQGLSTVELVHTPHEFWPYRPGRTSNPVLRISVLDSSFNPPTLAHLTLINSRLPWHDPPCDQVTTSDTLDYDARLLLLSVRNADKSLKPGDASYIQRLEMMYLLSRSVAVDHTPSPLPNINNTAIAIIDEPTFVGKSTTLHPFLRTRLASLRSSFTSADLPTIPQPKLFFLMGLDTLMRIFSVNYYASEHELMRLLRNFLSPDAEDCRIVCARRASEDDAEKQIQNIADEFIRGERIHLMDIGKDQQTCSSSEVRAEVAVGDNDWRRLVTDLITNYLVDNKLYVSDTVSSPREE